MAIDSMKIRMAMAGLLLGCAAGAWASTPAPLTSLRQIHLLNNAEAATGIPVNFEATVTYYAKGDIDLFVQDDDVAIYVEASRTADLEPGDRVLVHGKTRASFRPDIVADRVAVLGHVPLPKPALATYEQLIRSELDCRRVTVQAKVRSANFVQFTKVSSTYLELLMDGGYIDATIVGGLQGDLKDLLDADVEITGAVSGKFDAKSQLTGIVLEVPSFTGLKVLSRATSKLDSLPITPMDDIMKGYSVHDRTERVRVHGTITYYEPGSAVVLQDGPRSLWVSTLFGQPMRVGDLADATGFPDARGGSLALTHAEVRDTGIWAPVQAQPTTLPELASGAHAIDLISVEGRVLMSVRQGDRDEYVLVSGGHLFSCIYHHPDEEMGVHLEPMKDVPVGSKVQVTGVAMVSYGSDPFQGPVAFEVLLRSFDDISVVARPSLLNVTNLTRVVMTLLLAFLAVGAWGWTLKAKIHRQTAALAVRIESEAALERRMARLEKRRSQILEDINGSRPLAEIIEQVTELVSFRLYGAAVWCEVAGGAKLGTFPQTADLRVISEDIPSRSGRTLGTLFAGFNPESPVAGDELDALSAGIELAALAIETRRLYDDLRRRSEFDLLTDIHNRFSFDKLLDELIAATRERAGIFGLIYVDLDEFKQVNDVYGHRVGDLYLQEVALRMKRQLRSGDMLARLGGDEFAALLPVVHSRADAEEVGARLARSFDDPIAVEGYFLRGTASIGIALYPEDGSTKDSLLSAADAAMYVDKHIRRQNSGMPVSRPVNPR
jgi:diguanylate cyclase (GGDEF)-like protein